MRTKFQFLSGHIYCYSNFSGLLKRLSPICCFIRVNAVGFLFLPLNEHKL